MSTKFTGGINIAIKIPKSKYEDTVTFYRNTLKLAVEEKAITNPTVSRTHEVKFGANILWLDCVDIPKFGWILRQMMSKLLPNTSNPMELIHAMNWKIFQKIHIG